MKNPIKVAKKSYSKILEIDTLSSRVDCLQSQITKNGDELQSLKAENTYLKELLYANFDITKAPSANGYFRLAQLANLKLLQAFKTLCEKNNLDFYLNFGSLLGAVRHKGYIPWDDDVDVMMIREDYNRLLTILDDSFKGTNLFYTHGDIIRIYYANTPMQLDIFPSDFYYRPVKDEHDRKKIGLKIFEVHQQNIKFDWDRLKEQKSTILDFSYDNIERLRGEICPETSGEEASKIHPAIYHGLEKSSIREIRSVHDYDWIYPLKKLPFEGIMMPVPNRPEFLLDDYYGDYMTWPSKIYPKHEDIQSRFSAENIRIMRNVVNGDIDLFKKVSKME